MTYFISKRTRLEAKVLSQGLGLCLFENSNHQLGWYQHGSPKAVGIKDIALTFLNEVNRIVCIRFFSVIEREF